MKTAFSVLALLTFGIVAIMQTPPAWADGHESKQKAVLVTGASSGIGRRIAETLAKEGYFVYAGARKQKDLDSLNAIENVEGVKLDVTVQEQIDAAVKQIEKGGLGLHGLVNNAGVFIGGPAIEVSDDELEWLFDVNVFGVYRVTQAFAPMIIESKGRITTIGSISGILSGQFFSHYSASKHAIEGYVDALARELDRFGVGVSVIEPGNYQSNIGLSAFQRMKEKGYGGEDSPYAEDFKNLMAWSDDRSQYKEPDEVAEAAMHALFSDKPKRRYMVVPNAEEAGWTINQAMLELVQLNDWQAYSFTREELIAMLDEAMAAQKE